MVVAGLVALGGGIYGRLNPSGQAQPTAPHRATETAPAITDSEGVIAANPYTTCGEAGQTWPTIKIDCVHAIVAAYDAFERERSGHAIVGYQHAILVDCSGEKAHLPCAASSRYWFIAVTTNYHDSRFVWYFGVGLDGAILWRDVVDLHMR